MTWKWKKSFRIKGKGGIGFRGGDAMAYKLTLPPDFPYGIEPETIIDQSSTLNCFYKAINIMASESQVLILIDSYNLSYSAYETVYSQIVYKLEKDNYIVHPVSKNNKFYPQNEEAGKWVRAHLSKASRGEQKKKYLIGDWYSSAGYEVPAVIYVTRYPNDPRNATYCQRAKAKLVIYHAPNAACVPSTIKQLETQQEPAENLPQQIPGKKPKSAKFAALLGLFGKICSEVL